ncbi:DUF7507 domain-containing protein [Streptomyces abyssomicinicus]|uniref:DUF7507 domain-containing protein n=1 Tax=Streptomyces abyssomicinicus TaxID=574929 RepID=UPI00124FBE96|nr:hypothetical protein [Streptomyces abyssomicinicus]
MGRPPRPFRRKARAGEGPPAPPPRRRRKWRTSALTALVTLAAGAGLTAPTPAVAQPWECSAQPGSAQGYLVRDVTDPVSGDPVSSVLLRVDPSTGATTQAATLDGLVDGIGFNTVDGYFYGVRADDRRVVRIHSDGRLEPVGATLPFGTGEPGTLLADFRGGAMLVANNSGDWALYGLVQGAPGGFGQIAAEGTVEPPSGLAMPGDWTYMRGPAGTGFYGVSRTTSGDPAEAHLVFFDLVARTLTDLGVRAEMAPGGDGVPYRATFTDGMGDLYVVRPDDTSLWRLTDVGGAQTEVSDTLPEDVRDGAQCRQSGGRATVTLAKSIEGGRARPEDQFSVWMEEAYTDRMMGSILTSGTQTHLEGDPIPVDVGGWYWVLDADGRYPESWVGPPDEYLALIRCVDSVGNVVAGHEYSSHHLFWQVPYRDDFVCTATNRNVGLVQGELHKDAEPREVSEAGQVITYRYKLVNSGNTTITEARLNDWHRPSGEHWEVDCPVPPGGLRPGDAVECGTREYVVTEEDLRHDWIENDADVQLRDEFDRYGHAHDWEYVEVHVPSPGIGLTKSAEPASVSRAGEKVTYTYRVVNTGGARLDDVTVRDHVLSGSGDLSPVDCPSTTLAPQQEMTCTATYTVSQQDVDQTDDLFNNAIASGVSPRGETVEGHDGAFVEVEPTVSLRLTKSAAPARVSDAGQNVTYSFVVENTGTATLDNLEIDDPRLTGHGRLGPVSCPTTVLAPGERTTCTANYHVSQADIDAGGFDNTATATADGAGRRVTDESSARVDADRTPGLSLVKTADLADDRWAAGRQVTYRYQVTNTGNTTLSKVAAADTAFDGHGAEPEATCPDTTLLPGDSTTCTATYTLVQADIDQGLVTNTATATGASPGGVAVTSNESDAAVTGTPDRRLTLTKRAEPATVTGPGQEVTYRFTVNNTGGTTLTGLRIVENEFTGTGGPLGADCPVTTLAPGATTTCTAAYRVTREDLDRPEITNIATAVADAGATEIVSEPAEAQVRTGATARLTLKKSASPARVTHAGQVIEYTYLITNAGDVTVREPGIDDDRLQAPGPDCGYLRIRPGETVTCVGAYTVTAQDVAAGRIVNRATAYGARADDARTVTSDTATAEVKVARPRLELTKTAEPAEVTRAGEEIFYRFTVTNRGGTVLDEIAVQETRFTGSAGPLRTDCPTGALAPGDRAVCNAHYTVTEADIAAGRVDNAATATALVPGGPAVTSPQATAQVKTGGTPPRSSLSVTKKAQVKDTDHDGRTDPGDVIVWHFTVSNTGTTPLTAMTVNDPRAGKVTCRTGVLAPGASTTCVSAPHRITRKDAKAGSITNTATATAKDPAGKKVTSAPAHSTVRIHTCSHHHKPRPPHRPGK